ncbi:MAG: hypothetical protein Q7K57_56095 [Burkholderiaceae bacterium]|nr:hypothetical protein [Burkholderiaceae bacterium]
MGELPHRMLAVSRKYVDIACGLTDCSDVAALTIDETSCAMRHSYATRGTDADARRISAH